MCNSVIQALFILADNEYQRECQEGAQRGSFWFGACMMRRPRHPPIVPGVEAAGLLRGIFLQAFQGHRGAEGLL